MSEKSFFDNNEDEIIFGNFDEVDKSKKLPDKHSSLLLGAGFSVNKGYPTADKLNEKILKVNLENYSVKNDGTLTKVNSSEEDPFSYLPSALSKNFMVKLIELFENEEGPFDYEKFYDYIVNPKLKESQAFQSTTDAFRKKCGIDSKEIPFDFQDNRLLEKSITLLIQLIEVLLVDKSGKNFYKPINLMKPLPKEYKGFLQMLEKLGENSIVHAHTLNHDLLFETFNHTGWIGGELSNGFNELGSKFYGRENDNKMIRLEYFSNRYDTRYRLYKLHGSLDQFPFRHQDDSPTEHIKTKKGVNISNFYKEVETERGGFSYENDFTNYYADFLSGTTNKILRYDEGGYYKEVFSHFRENLKNSDKLIIVGYECKDSKINEIILENFEYKNKEVLIIDPYPSDDVESFADKINAEIIKQTPDKPLLDKIKF
jgi:hypothetical protein